MAGGEELGAWRAGPRGGAGAMRLGAWPRVPVAAVRARSGPVLGRQGDGAGELLEAALEARRRRQAGAAAPGTRW
jgi:hypothetical protein